MKNLFRSLQSPQASVWGFLLEDIMEKLEMVQVALRELGDVKAEEITDIRGGEVSDPDRAKVHSTLQGVDSGEGPVGSSPAGSEGESGSNPDDVKDRHALPACLGRPPIGPATHGGSWAAWLVVPFQSWEADDGAVRLSSPDHRAFDPFGRAGQFLGRNSRHDPA